jgi:hypothetical protein
MGSTTNSQRVRPRTKSLGEDAGDRYLSQLSRCHKRTTVPISKCMKHNRNDRNYTTHNTYRWLTMDRCWGVAVRGSEPHPGDRIDVHRRSGEVKPETVSQVLWSNGEVWLCRIAQSTATGELSDATDEPVSTAGKYPHLMKTDRP